MAMVCPQCRTSYDQRLQCPACSTRLLYRASHTLKDNAPGSGWRQTPWGRILIGLLLAQGLFYGLRHLLTGVLLALQNEGTPVETWAALQGLVLVQGLQVFTLLLGGLLAGGGQRQGILLGAVVGVWNGVFSVLSQAVPGQALTAVALYGQPLIHTTFGAVGGWLGCMIWKPLPLPASPAASRLMRKLGAARRRVSLFAGRVAWFRVFLGAALAVAGSLSATLIFETVIKYSGDKLSASVELQDWLVTWEIKALAILFGGAVAGSTTSNGLKQGLCVGLVTTAVLLGVQANRNTPTLFALTLISSLTLALAGGWFGSQLLPPVVPYKRSRGIGPASA
jgi:hypothetical protein